MLQFLAQSTQPAAFDLSFLGSIGGIIALTAIIISLSKDTIAKIQGLARIPVFVFTAVISVLLTLVAMFVTHTIKGTPSEVIIAVVLQILGATGYHVDGVSKLLVQSMASSSASSNTPIDKTATPGVVADKSGDSTSDTKPPLSLALLVGSATLFLACSGCASTETGILAQGVKVGETPIHNEYLLWVDEKVGEGTLTPASGQIRHQAVQRVEDLVTKQLPATQPSIFSH